MTEKRCSTRAASEAAVCARERVSSAPRRPPVKMSIELLRPAL
jgi:hypothetical protein